MCIRDREDHLCLGVQVGHLCLEVLEGLFLVVQEVHQCLEGQVQIHDQGEEEVPYLVVPVGLYLVEQEVLWLLHVQGAEEVLYLEVQVDHLYLGEVEDLFQEEQVVLLLLQLLRYRQHQLLLDH